MAAKVSAVQMTYIMISFSFFTTIASQPYKQTMFKHVKLGGRWLLGAILKNTELLKIQKLFVVFVYFLVEIFRMSKGPCAAPSSATADGHAVVFRFFIPVCVLPV